MELKKAKPEVLYVFGGEKSQGAEIVIERLMCYNTDHVNAHLIMSPGDFASGLLSANKPYKITTLNDLKKLNRSAAGKAMYYFKAAGNFFTVSYKVYRYIKQNKITIVHANTMVIAAYLIPLVKYARIFLPHLQWYWSDHDLKYFNELDIRMSKQCLGLFEKTLVVSEILKHKYNNSNKAVVLYNGLDTNVFKEDNALRKKFRDDLGIDEDSIVIGLAAVISPGKGQLELINAFNNLVNNYANIRLILAGGFAADTPAYSREVEQAFGKSKHLAYLGLINRMTEFYNGCDIIINNSNGIRSEPLGTTIYEAMACEKLVIASDTGGNPEIITGDEDGFIFKAGDEGQLQQKLEHVIAKFNTLGPVRIAARRKVIEKFNIKTMVSAYNQILGIN